MTNQVRTTYCAAVLAASLIGWGTRVQAEERTLRWETVVDAPRQAVWDACTTKEGIASWMVPKVEVDFRIGGTIRTHDNPDAGPDDPGWITRHILSYEPGYLLTYRSIGPAKAPVTKVIEKVWGVLRLDEFSPGRTRVTVSSCGWGQGPEWDAAEEFYNRNNPQTLDRLRKHFARDRQTPIDPLGILRRLVGGEWIFEHERGGGSVFRCRNRYEVGPDGKTVIGLGWLGDSGGMFFHASTQVWREPGSGVVHFQSIDQSGGVARGEVRATAFDRVIWDWDLRTAEDKLFRYRVHTVIVDDDTFRGILERLDDPNSIGNEPEMTFKRVSQTPARFLQVR